MKTTLRFASIGAVIAMVAIAGCATAPAYQPDVYQGQVHNRVDRSPQVGDTGTAGAAQFVYTPAGWVRI